MPPTAVTRMGPLATFDSPTSKNYNQGKNGREKEERKTKNDVTGLDAERGLQQVEGKSWRSW